MFVWVCLEAEANAAITITKTEITYFKSRNHVGLNGRYVKKMREERTPFRIFSLSEYSDRAAIQKQVSG